VHKDVDKLARQIKLIFFDVDGVHTDGKLYFTATGETMKAFHSLDGVGIKMLLCSNFEVALITGRKSTIVSARAAELGIKHLYQGKTQKVGAFNDCLQKLNISAKNAAYMGDDVNDLPVMQRAALSIAPANAIDLVKANADYITQRSGGNGAVREVCDFLLRAQYKWQQAIRIYEP